MHFFSPLRTDIASVFWPLHFLKWALVLLGGVYLQMVIALSVFEENDLVHCWVLVPLLLGLAVI